MLRSYGFYRAIAAVIVVGVMFIVALVLRSRAPVRATADTSAQARIAAYIQDQLRTNAANVKLVDDHGTTTATIQTSEGVRRVVIATEALKH